MLNAINIHVPARRRMLRLAAWASAIAAVWLVALPWLARQPAIDARIRRLDAQGIDPSAMYYTELDMMQPILEDLNRRHHGGP